MDSLYGTCVGFMMGNSLLADMDLVTLLKILVAFHIIMPIFKNKPYKYQNQVHFYQYFHSFYFLFSFISKNFADRPKYFNIMLGSKRWRQVRAMASHDRQPNSPTNTHHKFVTHHSKSPPAQIQTHDQKNQPANLEREAFCPHSKLNPEQPKFIRKPGSISKMIPKHKEENERINGVCSAPHLSASKLRRKKTPAYVSNFSPETENLFLRFAKYLKLSEEEQTIQRGEIVKDGLIERKLLEEANQSIHKILANLEGQEREAHLRCKPKQVKQRKQRFKFQKNRQKNTKELSTEQRNQELRQVSKQSDDYQLFVQITTIDEDKKTANKMQLSSFLQLLLYLKNTIELTLKLDIRNKQLSQFKNS